MWTRKLCEKSEDGRIKWTRWSMVFLEGCSFSASHPWLPQHPTQSWKINGFRSPGNHAPIPTLHPWEFCRYSLFCMTESHLLWLPATPHQPQVFGKRWREGRERWDVHLSILSTMWFHYSDYGAYSNQQNKDPCPWDPQFKGREGKTINNR